MEPSEIESDVKAMNDSFEGIVPEVKVEPEVKKEETPEPKPEEEKEVTPEPERVTEEKSEVEESTPEPEVTPAPVAVDPKDKEIEDLKARLAKLESPPEKPIEKPAELSITEQVFISDDTDLDELTRDPKKLNEAFNNVYKKGMQDTRNALINELPNLILQQVEMRQQVKEMTDKFYKDNSDLTEFKSVVKVVYADLAEANPTKTFNQIMGEVAGEARKRLKLPSPKPVEVKKVAPKPSLPVPGKKAGNIPESKPVDDLDSEFEAMDKAVNR
jgi:hypothetical protein